jgi:hypothetical protein
MLKFKLWLEARDLYGFDDAKKIDPAMRHDTGDLPIQAFNFNGMLDELERTKVGGVRGSRPFGDQVQWGTVVGATRARLTPNQGILIERKIADLHGEPVWITKRIYKIKSNEFAEQEDNVASEIGEHVQDVAMEQLDTAARDYKNLFVLTSRVAERVKGQAVNMFVYEEIKKVNDNNYNILFSLIGAGVGRILHSRGHSPSYTPAGIIDLSYDEHTGIIRSILSTIDIDDDSDPWEISLPYAQNWFGASQKIEEMVNIIIAGLRFV